MYSRLPITRIRRDNEFRVNKSRLFVFLLTLFRTQSVWGIRGGLPGTIFSICLMEVILWAVFCFFYASWTYLKYFSSGFYTLPLKQTKQYVNIILSVEWLFFNFRFSPSDFCCCHYTVYMPIRKLIFVYDSIFFFFFSGT